MAFFEILPFSVPQGEGLVVPSPSKDGAWQIAWKGWSRLPGKAGCARQLRHQAYVQVTAGQTQA